MECNCTLFFSSFCQITIKEQKKEMHKLRLETSDQTLSKLQPTFLKVILPEQQ